LCSWLFNSILILILPLKVDVLIFSSQLFYPLIFNNSINSDGILINKESFDLVFTNCINEHPNILLSNIFLSIQYDYSASITRYILFDLYDVKYKSIFNPCKLHYIKFPEDSIFLSFNINWSDSYVDPMNLLLSWSNNFIYNLINIWLVLLGLWDILNFFISLIFILYMLSSVSSRLYFDS